jgi:hypothetical protein
MRRTTLIALGAAVCSATACASHPVEHAPPQHLRDTPDTLVGPLRSIPRYDPGRGAYQITSTSIVTHDESGVARTDTLTTEAIVHDDARWTYHGLDVTGTVVSRVLRGSEGIAALPAVVVEPVPFTATVDTASSRVSFISDSAAASVRGCPAPNTEALAAARDLLTAIPRSLAPGASWSDSLETTTCRGELSVRSAAVRHFTVTLDRVPASPEGVVIVVSHTTEARLTGATLTGTRHAQAYQEYDALTGDLLGGHSKSDLDLQVGPSGETHRVHQHVDTTVRPTTD